MGRFEKERTGSTSRRAISLKVLSGVSRTINNAFIIDIDPVIRHVRNGALLSHGPIARLPPEIRLRSVMRLRQLDAATVVADLRFPPSNRLEALSGDRAGRYSIRIND